ncbi:MAG: ATP-binding protein [Planctomycetota bacterium]
MSPGVADEVRVALPSDPRYLPMVRGLVERGAEIAGFAEEECQRIVLGVTEAVTNVMRHGYGGAKDQRIDLTLRVPIGLFYLEIRDQGKYVNLDAIRSRPLDEVRPGGLGVHLIRSTMDSVTYRKNDAGGTTLTLMRRLAGSAPSSPTAPEEG